MLLLFLLNLKFNKKGVKKNMRSEFFNETLIILLLLFDIREQLLIRKKRFSSFQNRTCYENVA